ncbi:MAG: prephenate dehydrogenase/arogenate dehydrogenase family protein [Nitrososphaera sp.]
MKVAIIGGAGKMGAWFAAHFARGHDVSAFDVKPFLIENVKSTASIASCVAGADLVMVCVPVSKTPAIVRQCASSMKSGSTIAEISSVKSKTHPALKKVRSDITPLCIHPMYGPGANEKKQLKMLLVPVRDARAETVLVRELFPKMSLQALPSARMHDRAIAAVLGLTYFVNVAFAGMLAKEKLATLKQVGGTTFGVQSMLAESVMTDEPELISALIRDNPYSAGYIQQYLKNAQELAGATQGKLATRLKRTKSLLQRQQDLQESYRRMYEMLQGR